MYAIDCIKGLKVDRAADLWIGDRRTRRKEDFEMIINSTAYNSV
jgi:hypothetical protein